MPEANRLAYATELNTLTKEDPTLTYLPTLTREPTHSDWQGCRGRVQTLLEPAAFETHTGRPLDPDNCRVLLCGNPSMIDDVTQQLAPLGFTPQDRDHPDGHILTERYW